MEYKEILEQISKKDNTSAEEVEIEMKKALEIAGFECSVEEFIFAFRDSLLKKQTKYRKII